MAELKTRPTGDDVGGFVAAIADVERQADCRTLIELMRALTGQPAVLWGTMVGFGTKHYRYDSGREGDTFLIGFANRSPKLVVYPNVDLAANESVLVRLGKHVTGKGCVYVHRLSDIDLDVLAELLRAALPHD